MLDGHRPRALSLWQTGHRKGRSPFTCESDCPAHPFPFLCGQWAAWTRPYSAEVAQLGSPGGGACRLSAGTPLGQKTTGGHSQLIASKNQLDCKSNPC